MNIRIKQILTVALLTITLVTSNANASFIDWLVGNTAKADQDASGSFDHLNDQVMNPASHSDTSMLLGTTNAIVAAASPTSTTAPVAVSRRVLTVQVSGYNSEVGQTDDSPFITANGTHVRDGIVAANIISNGRNIPFNTIIKFKNCGSIPEDKIFIVTDRLNKRYTNNVDIWFESHTDALKFGRRTCQIEIIG